MSPEPANVEYMYGTTEATTGSAQLSLLAMPRLAKRKDKDCDRQPHQCD